MNTNPNNKQPLNPQERASQNISNLTKAYIYSEKARKQAQDGAMNKRKRGRAEVRSPMKTASYMFSYLAHGTSIIIALPFIVFLLGMALVKIGYVAPGTGLLYGIGIFLLYWFEYGQSVTLDQVWDNYFNDGKHVREACIVAFFFSAFSIISSGASAYHFFSENQYVFFAIGFSVMVESLIIYCNFYRHRYDHEAMLEIELVNDLLHNHEWNPLHPAIGDKYKKELGQLTNNPVQEIPSPIQVPTANETKIFGTKLNGHTLHRQSTNMVTPMPVVQVDENVDENGVKPVRTAEEAWSKNQIKNNKRRYDYRVTNEGKNYKRLAQLRYFEYLSKNWDNLNVGGFIPQLSVPERREWFDKNHPEESKEYKSLK